MERHLTIRPKADFIVVDPGDMDWVEVEKKQLSLSFTRNIDRRLYTADRP